MARAKAAPDPDTLENGDPRPKGLYAKIAYVMGQVGYVPKNGFNKHFNYNYVRDVDLTEHLRPLLAEIGLVCIPSQSELVQHTDGEKRSQHVMFVHHEFTWVDAETGEQFVQRLWGAGQDGEDKGPFKAMTGALKYAVMKLFMVPTGDDPEATDGDGNSTDTRPAHEREGQRESRRGKRAESAPAEEEEEEQEEAEPEPEEPRRRRGRKEPEPPPEEEEEEEPEPEPEPVKKRGFKDRAKPVDENDPKMVETLIKGAIDAIVDLGQQLEEAELETSEEENLDAAAQLIEADMEDRPRYLKALQKAKKYLEELAAKRLAE